MTSIQWDSLDKPFTDLTVFDEEKEKDEKHTISIEREVIPIIIVPGIMGTALRNTKTTKVVWKPYSRIWMMKKYALWVSGKKRRRKLISSNDGEYSNNFLEVDDDKTITKGGDGCYSFTGPKCDRHKNGKGVYNEFIKKLKEEKWEGLNKVFEFPVYGFGYNWTNSNEVSGEKLKERIDEIKETVTNTTGLPCNKVILITHSMGGLVARSASVISKAEKDILGIIHGTQPVTGAPLIYAKTKIGNYLSDSKDSKELNLKDLNKLKDLKKLNLKKLNLKEIIKLVKDLKDLKNLRSVKDIKALKDLVDLIKEFVKDIIDIKNLEDIKKLSFKDLSLEKLKELKELKEIKELLKDLKNLKGLKGHKDFKEFAKTFEARTAGSVLGKSAKQNIPIIGNTPGGLELLPSASYKNNDNCGKWLTFTDMKGKTTGYPKECPYDEIYKVKGTSDESKYTDRKLHGFIDPNLLNPKKSKSKKNQEKAPNEEWTKYLEKIEAAKIFQEKLGTKAHPNTYSFYGDGHPTFDRIELYSKKNGFGTPVYKRGHFRGRQKDDINNDYIVDLKLPKIDGEKYVGDNTAPRSSTTTELIAKIGKETITIKKGLKNSKLGHMDAFENSDAQDFCISSIYKMCKEYMDKHESIKQTDNKKEEE